MAASRLGLGTVALSILLLGGCDFGEEVSLVKPDGSPLLCPNNQQTSFEYRIHVINTDTGKSYPEQTGRVRVDPRGGPLSTRPDRVGVTLLRGERTAGTVPWFKITIYCGDSKTPFFESPKIAPKDLRPGAEKSTYEYLVTQP
jgi:hypothetical protein